MVLCPLTLVVITPTLTIPLGAIIYIAVILFVPSRTLVLAAPPHILLSLEWQAIFRNVKARQQPGRNYPMPAKNVPSHSGL